MVFQCLHAPRRDSYLYVSEIGNISLSIRWWKENLTFRIRYYVVSSKIIKSYYYFVVYFYLPSSFYVSFCSIRLGNKSVNYKLDYKKSIILGTIAWTFLSVTYLSKLYMNSIYFLLHIVEIYKNNKSNRMICQKSTIWPRSQPLISHQKFLISHPKQILNITLLPKTKAVKPLQRSHLSDSQNRFSITIIATHMQSKVAD